MSNLTSNEEIVCIVTLQSIGGYEHTVLYDADGNKYLKLEKFEIKNQPPKFEEEANNE